MKFPIELVPQFAFYNTFYVLQKSFYFYRNFSISMSPIKIVLAVFLLLSSTSVVAHEMTASGGDASGSGGSVAFSVGQIIYTEALGTNGSATQGNQQAYELFSVGVEQTDLHISLTVFPNPTSHNLTLQIQDLQQNLSYQLTDAMGHILDQKTMTTKSTSIPMEHYAAATYFLNIKQKNKTIKAFKIIKN